MAHSCSANSRRRRLFDKGPLTDSLEDQIHKVLSTDTEAVVERGEEVEHDVGRTFKGPIDLIEHTLVERNRCGREEDELAIVESAIDKLIAVQLDCFA